jgi:lysozyme
MKTSPRGIEDLVLSEDLRLKAYRDSGGVWTIGVGHTAAAGPPVPRAGMTITRQEALDILARDLAKFEAGVNAVLPNVPQHVFDAAVSFHFNTGKIGSASWPRAYKAGRMAEAERLLKLWNKDNGKIVQGLVNRRAHEADLMFRGKYRSGPAPTPTPAPTPVPVGDPVLRRGDGITANLNVATTTAIKEAQRLLAERGFNPGSPPDGMFGEKTEAMVAAFQRNRGLLADGVIGPKTWAALRSPNTASIPASPPPAEASVMGEGEPDGDDPDAITPVEWVIAAGVIGAIGVAAVLAVKLIS